MALASSAIAVLLLLLQHAAARVAYSGDAARDFNDTSIDRNTGQPRNFGVQYVPLHTETPFDPRVGMPPQFAAGTYSGWDMYGLFWQYDSDADDLLIGIDCVGICGDADGDGDPSHTSATLASLGGVDLANLAQTETYAIAISLDLAVADVLPSFVPDLIVPFNFIIGIPAGQPEGASANPGAGGVGFLPCSIGQTGDSYLSLQNCFGVYDYQLTADVALANRFLRPTLNANGTAWSADYFANPSKAQPDLELTIHDTSDLKASVGAGFSQSRKEPWSLLFQVFSGSFQADGIGQCYMPSQTNYDQVEFPCLILDVCDVCLGDNSTCLDCAGIPNGPNIYDLCDVCGGDNKECLDCAGVPNGAATYDVCDVCDGNGTTCLDCKGVSNGPATYDVCDVCDGQGITCFDCAGIANGPTTYDVCDVCGGDGSSCLDCLKVPNGAHVYDQCDVCGGNSNTCLDCAGTPNGAAVYDRCDVCNGNDTTCLDCLNVPNGPHVYDVCDICNGDGSECNDCAGVPLGTCQYDACDVCCGDGTTCLDCADTPFGTCKYDNCGVCCGDGSSCICLKIDCCPVDEVDYALLSWTLVATSDRIEHSIDVLEGIKEELCRYDVDRGNLASDIAGYLGTANEFRDVIDNFNYVQLWFKSTLEEALQSI